MTGAAHGAAPADIAAPGRRWWSPRYLLIVGILLYGGIAVYMGVDRVGAALLTIQPLPFAAMMASLAFAMGVRALKWRLALGPRQDSTALFFIAKGVGDWSPGRVGEFSPLLVRRHRSARLGAWIAYDRLLEVVVTAAMGLFGLALIGWIPWGIAVAAFLAGLLAASGVLWWLGRIEEKSSSTISRSPGVFARLFAIARTLRREAASLATAMPFILPLTILGKASDLLSVWLLFVAFGERIQVPLIMVTRCARAVLASVPITADQTGVPHATELGIINEVAGIPGPTIWAALLAEIVAYSAVFWPLFAFAIWRYRQPETPA